MPGRSAVRPASSASRYGRRMRRCAAMAATLQPSRSRAARRSAPTCAAEAGPASYGVIMDRPGASRSVSRDLRSWSTARSSPKQFRNRPSCENACSERPASLTFCRARRGKCQPTRAKVLWVPAHRCAVTPAPHARAPRRRSARAGWRPPRRTAGSAAARRETPAKSRSAIASFTGKTDPAAIDSVVMPSPASVIASSGRPAASPQTEIGRPAACARSTSISNKLSIAGESRS